MYEETLQNDVITASRSRDIEAIASAYMTVLSTSSSFRHSSMIALVGTDIPAQARDQLDWFVQHPLICTVLWYLGGEAESVDASACVSKAASTPVCERSLPYERAAMRRKEDCKGSLENFISHVQGSLQRRKSFHGSSHTQSCSTSETLTLGYGALDASQFTSTSSSVITEGDDRGAGVLLQRETKTMLDADLENEYNEWGWYVAITPPQPEPYQRH